MFFFSTLKDNPTAAAAFISVPNSLLRGFCVVLQDNAEVLSWLSLLLLFLIVLKQH